MKMGKIIGTLPRDRFKLADHHTQVTAKSGSTVGPILHGKLVLGPFSSGNNGSRDQKFQF